MSTTLHDNSSTLPLDAQHILELAAHSMFHLFSSVSQGMFLVNRKGRIVWVSEGYQRFLPGLGFSSLSQFLGRMVEEVIPNTQMRRVLETGDWHRAVRSAQNHAATLDQQVCPAAARPG